MGLINKSPKFSLQIIIKAKIILLMITLSLRTIPASAFANSTVVSLINSQRTAAGLSSLQQNSKLNISANSKAIHLCQNNYWGHTGPDGVTPWSFISKAGYEYLGAAENLARDYYDENTVVNAWMASSTHKDNILNGNYTDVGVGYYLCTCGDTSYSIIVTHFGYTSNKELPPPAPSAIVPEPTYTKTTNQVQNDSKQTKSNNVPKTESFETNDINKNNVEDQTEENNIDNSAQIENYSSKLQDASGMNFHEGYWPHYLLLFDFLYDLHVIEIYEYDFNANNFLTDLTVE